MSGRSGRAVEQASGRPRRRTRGGSPDLDRLFTKAKAAEAFPVWVRLEERCMLEGRVRHVKLCKFVRIPMTAVAEFIDAGEVPARL